MKYQIKLSLPNYFLILSFVFAACLPMIRRVSMCNAIGGNLDTNFAFLSIIIFSNTYFVEKQLHTAEIFYLISGRGTLIEIYKRIVVKGVFLVLLAVATFGLYLLGKPHLLMGETGLKLFLEALFAISSSVFFWGIASCLFVNLSSNLWIGVAVTIVIWFIANSTVAQKLPIYLNMFAYGQLDYTGKSISNWQISKIVGGVTSILLLLFNRVLIQRSPCK